MSYTEEVLNDVYDECEDMYAKYREKMRRKPCAQTVGALEVLNEIFWRFDLIEEYEYDGMKKKLAKWTTKNSSRNLKPKAKSPTLNSSM